MGGGMKTSSLLGIHFQLICKHCKEVFNDFKLLKSHLKKLHQIRTASTNATGSNPTKTEKIDKVTVKTKSEAKHPSPPPTLPKFKSKIGQKDEFESNSGSGSVTISQIARTIIAHNSCTTSTQESQAEDKGKHNRKRQMKNSQDEDDVHYEKSEKDTPSPPKLQCQVLLKSIGRHKDGQSISNGYDHKTEESKVRTSSVVDSKINQEKVEIQRNLIKAEEDRGQAQTSRTRTFVVQDDSDDNSDEEREPVIVWHNGKAYRTVDGNTPPQSVHVQNLVQSAAAPTFIFPSSLTVIPVGRSSDVSSVTSQDSQPQSRDASLTSQNPSRNSLETNSDQLSEEDEEEEEVLPPQPISPPKIIPKGYRLCPQCPRLIRFPRKGAKTEFNEHLEIHAGVRVFVCPYCLRGFKDPVSLLSHTGKFHTGLMAFECETCSRTFKTSAGLSTHQRMSHECRNRDAIRI